MRSLTEYKQLWIDVFNNIDELELEKIIDLLAETASADGKLFICGNGGSAATAEHFAVDLGVGSLIRGKSLSAISLASNLSAVSAIGNDVNFDDIFSLQLRLIGKAADVLIVISASGNSKNLINVVKEAKVIGMKTIAFLGFDGGKIKNEVDYLLHARSSIGEYGIVEDIHLSLTHYITERIRKRLNDNG